MTAAIRRVTYAVTLILGIAIGANWHQLNLTY